MFVTVMWLAISLPETKELTLEELDETLEMMWLPRSSRTTFDYDTCNEGEERQGANCGAGKGERAPVEDIDK